VLLVALLVLAGTVFLAAVFLLLVFLVTGLVVPGLVSPAAAFAVVFLVKTVFSSAMSLTRLRVLHWYSALVENTRPFLSIEACYRETSASSSGVATRYGR
jgi:hypothetical protein